MAKRKIKKDKGKATLRESLRTTILTSARKGAKTKKKIDEMWKDFHPLDALVDLIADHGFELHAPGGLILKFRIDKETEKKSKKKAKKPKKPKKKAAKKTPVKSAARKKSLAKKAPSKKAPRKKAVPKKSPAKKASPKKLPVKDDGSPG